MKVRYRDTPLPVDMIYPHPANPRKDVGDVTELAESIKANGLFQNITVVRDGPGVEKAHPEEDIDGYTVIIGHRRLAAAKMAGLETVPCMVVEMDEKEQIATMLLENIQRVDLSVYEQAMGFQMMLDLGETADGISKKTGFSQTTIRHRLKLLELDEKEFAKAQERQAKITDYIELEKITDPELKNEALKAIGTANFNFAIQQALKKEAAKKTCENARERCKEHFEEIGLSAGREYIYVTSLWDKDLTEDKLSEQFERLEEKGVKWFAVDCAGSTYFTFRFYREETKQEVKEKAQKDAEKEKAEADKQMRILQITDLEKQARDLRIDFVKDFANREYIGKLTEAMLLYPEYLDDFDIFHVGEMIGVDGETEDEIAESKEYKELVKKHPEKVILLFFMSAFETRYRSALHDWQWGFQKNTDMERWYAILTSVGYKMSSEETKLLAGTHKVFKK